MKILIVLCLVNVSAGIPIPFPYDPNQCAGRVVSWGVSEPNVLVIYSAALFSKSGRPVDPNLEVWQVDPTGVGPTIFTRQYHGKLTGMLRDKLLDPNDPNNATIHVHAWTISWYPTKQGIQHINLRARYAQQARGPEWKIPPGLKEIDTNTILLNVVEGDMPLLQPGVAPDSLYALGLNHIQWRKKRGLVAGVAKIMQ